MPVTHGHDDAGVERGPQLGLERGGLPLGELADGRSAADFGVVGADFFGPVGGDQPRQRLPRARQREVDGVEGIRPAGPLRYSGRAVEAGAGGAAVPLVEAAAVVVDEYCGYSCRAARPLSEVWIGGVRTRVLFSLLGG